jgi:hypothetical protein
MLQEIPEFNHENDSSHGTTAFLLTTFSMEAFFNDLPVAIETFAITNPVQLVALKQMLDNIEQCHGSLALKYQISYFILRGTPIDNGSDTTIKVSKLLIDIRNSFRSLETRLWRTRARRS